MGSEQPGYPVPSLNKHIENDHDFTHQDRNPRA